MVTICTGIQRGCRWGRGARCRGRGVAVEGGDGTPRVAGTGRRGWRGRDETTRKAGTGRRGCRGRDDEEGGGGATRKAGAGLRGRRG